MAQELYELPEGWEWKAFSSVGKITTGNTPPKKYTEYYLNGSHPFVKPPELGSVKPIIETPEQLSEEGFKVAKPVEKGSILVCCIGSIGKIGIAGRRLATNQQINSITFGLLVDSHYGFYFALTLKKLMNELSNSAVVSIINKSTFSKIQIPVPPLEEQQRIVAQLDALFSRIDQSIAQLQHTLAQTKALWASALDKAFEEALPYGGAESSSTKKLGELVKMQSGTGFPKKYQGATAGSIPFLKVSDMNLPGNESSIVRWNNTIDGDTQKTIKAKPMPAGTIIFPKIGAAIGTNKKRILTCPCAYDNNVMGIKSDGELADEYLFYWIQSIDLSDWASKSDLPSMKASTVKKVHLSVPPLPEQKKIVAQLDAISERTQALEAATDRQIQQLKALKASLLDAAFRGQL